MGLFEKFVEKIASQVDVDRELELIERVQKYDDQAALMELRYRFRPIIRKAIQYVKGGAYGVDDAMWEAAAMKEFKRSVMNFDPQKKNKPSTYIMTNMRGSLMKHRNELANETRMPTRKTDQSRLIDNARVYAEKELGHAPEIPDIQKALGKLYGEGKVMSIKEIEDIQGRVRRELSADRTLGTPDEAENITYGDVLNVSKENTEDYLRKTREIETLERALSTLTPDERKLYEEYTGIGKFKNRKAPSIAALALNNNITNPWEAQKIIRQITEKLKKELGAK